MKKWDYKIIMVEHVETPEESAKRIVDEVFSNIKITPI